MPVTGHGARKSMAPPPPSLGQPAQAGRMGPGPHRAYRSSGAGRTRARPRGAYSPDGRTIQILSLSQGRECCHRVDPSAHARPAWRSAGHCGGRGVCRGCATVGLAWAPNPLLKPGAAVLRGPTEDEPEELSKRTLSMARCSSSSMSALSRRKAPVRRACCASGVSAAWAGVRRTDKAIRSHRIRSRPYCGRTGAARSPTSVGRDGMPISFHQVNGFRGAVHKTRARAEPWRVQRRRTAHGTRRTAVRTGPLPKNRGGKERSGRVEFWGAAGRLGA
jgi:hypothetical protein